MRIDIEGRDFDDDMLARMCSSKSRYPSREKAKRALKTVNIFRAKKGEQPLRMYKCPVCKGWHFTSVGRR